MFKPCIIVPVYKHAAQFAEFIPKLKGFDLIIVDDGNDAVQKAVLAELAAQYGAELVSLAANSGKGAAMLKGFEYAFNAGYSHALQIDADGQHDAGDIAKFMELGAANPGCIINGNPVYDASVPASRRNGRKITNFWVCIETLSRDIGDAMCGFRLYPLKEIAPLVKKGLRFKRMASDIELIVRAHWRKIKIINLDTRVTYPPNGLSNFRLVKDNITISAMHTLLVCSMPLHKLLGR